MSQCLGHDETKKCGRGEEEVVWVYQEVLEEQIWEAAVDNAWIQEIIH